MLRHIAFSIALGAATTVTTGCASTPGAARPSAHVSATRAGWLTESDLRPFRMQNALSALRALRPSYLNDRGRTSLLLETPDTPEVYVDGMYFGPLASLRDLPVTEVARMRFLSLGDAVLRYGARRSAGVIEVVTVR